MSAKVTYECTCNYPGIESPKFITADSKYVASQRWAHKVAEYFAGWPDLFEHGVVVGVKATDDPLDEPEGFCVVMISPPVFSAVEARDIMQEESSPQRSLPSPSTSP